MEDLWKQFTEWFMGLGEQYGVNPLIFGSIYLGAVPFFTLSVGWIIRNYRRGQSIALPVLAASFFFVSAYLYLFIAGHDIPWWVYLLLGAMIVYGGYTTYKSTRKKVKEAAQDTDHETESP